MRGCRRSRGAREFAVTDGDGNLLTFFERLSD
jgi:hypothetical protein